MPKSVARGISVFRFTLRNDHLAHHPETKKGGGGEGGGGGRGRGRGGSYYSNRDLNPAPLDPESSVFNHPVTPTPILGLGLMSESA